MQTTDFQISPFDTTCIEQLFKLIEANRARLEDFFAVTVENTRTIEDTKKLCKEFDEKRRAQSYFPFVIQEKSNANFIGWVDIKNVDLNVPKCEIGYFIDSNYEGKGIITKAVANVIERMQKEFHFKKMLIRAHARNKGSIKIALKNGFELEGVIKRDYRTTSGELLDLNYYGKLF